MYTKGHWDPDWRQYKRREALENLAQKRYPKLMDTTQQKQKERREKILAFWRKHGTQATEDAFSVCERTLFRWQKNILPKSRAHRNGYHRRTIPLGLEREIIRLRREHPRLGKEKLTPLLASFCLSRGLAPPAETTIGRMLSQLKREGKLPDPRTLRLDARTGILHAKKQLPKKEKVRRGSFLPEKPGDLLQVDGVLIFTLGQRRYTFTAVDLVSRWAFSKTYKTASSRNGADFLSELLQADPFTVRRVQTDNGSEFLKEFRTAAEAAELIQLRIPLKECIDSGGKSALIPFECAHRFRSKTRRVSPWRETDV